MKTEGSNTESGPVRRHRRARLQVGVGFLGADRELASTTNPTGQQDCIRNVQAAICEPRLQNDSSMP